MMIRGLSSSMLVCGLSTFASFSASAQAVDTTMQLWGSENTTAEIGLPLGFAVTRACDLWVSDPGVGIHRFKCEGAYLGRVGREGRGPGEFLAPYYLSTAPGRQVVVIDPQLQRMSFFTDGAQFIRSVQFPLSGEQHGEAAGFAVTSAGPRVWTTYRPLPIARPQDDRSYVWSAGEKDGTFDSLVGFAGPENIVIRAERTYSRIDAPFRRRPIVAFHGDTMIVGRNDSPVFRIYDAEGKAVRSFRAELPTRRVDADDRKAYTDSVRVAYFAEVERMRYGPELRRLFTERYDDLMEAVDYPETWQLFDITALADDGVLWIALPGAGKSFSREWRGVSRTGRTIARVRVPHRGSIVAAYAHKGVLFVSEFDWAEQIGRVAAYQLRR